MLNAIVDNNVDFVDKVFRKYQQTWIAIQKNNISILKEAYLTRLTYDFRYNYREIFKFNLIISASTTVFLFFS